MVPSRRRSSVLIVLLSSLALGGCGAKQGAGIAAAPGPSGGVQLAPQAAAPAAGAPGAKVIAPKAYTPGDLEAADSSPLPSGARSGPKAPSPAKVRALHEKASTTFQVSPGAPSDAEVSAELKEMKHVMAAARHRAATEGPLSTLALTAKGNAETPGNAPPAIAAMIAGANTIARLPYVYGGGHASFEDSAYDCSGSVSYVLASAGLLDAPLVSGQLAHWGDAGPGRWVTIYANAGHTFMYIAGTRYDTSGRAGELGSRWQTAPRTLAGFHVRHPPGL